MHLALPYLVMNRKVISWESRDSNFRSGAPVFTMVITLVLPASHPYTHRAPQGWGRWGCRWVEIGCILLRWPEKHLEVTCLRSAGPQGRNFRRRARFQLFYKILFSLLRQTAFAVCHSFIFFFSFHSLLTALSTYVSRIVSGRVGRTDRDICCLKTSKCMSERDRCVQVKHHHGYRWLGLMVRALDVTSLGGIRSARNLTPPVSFWPSTLSAHRNEQPRRSGLLRASVSSLLHWATLLLTFRPEAFRSVTSKWKDIWKKKATSAF